MSGKNRTGVSLQDGDKHIQLVREESPIVPPPDDLERYERILPGAAERMLSMAEKQQENLWEQRRDTSEKNHFLAVSGQIMIAFLCLCFVGITVAGVFLDRPNAAYIGAGTVACIIALSLISRKK
ncbi:MAG: DUF2335 domain-containing protein [Gammaproteobacteria bacterium]